MNPLEYALGRFLYELLAFGVATLVVTVIIIFSCITGYLSGRNR